MNILISTFSFPSIKGNIHDGRFVFSEAMAYAENGADVKVLTPHYPGGEQKESIHERLKVIRFAYFIPQSLQLLKVPGVPLYSRKSFLAVIQIPLLCFFFALNILKHACWADIIHAQWTVAALLALPAKWFLGNKIVVTARGSDLRLLPLWLNRFIHRRVDFAIDCFGPQPRNLAYRKRFSGNFIKLPLLVDAQTPQGMPEDMKKELNGKPDPFILLYVGRYDGAKIRDHFPLLTLIQTTNILKAKHLNFHVFYVGDGDEPIKKKMHQIIDRGGLHDRVTLLGPKMNVLDYMRFCDLGFGGFAFNAVSQEFTIIGKPQILVDVEPNRGTPWQHQVNALFVKPDDPVDLAKKITWAVEHKDLVKALGEQAKRDMSQYMMDSRTGGRVYLCAFEDLLG